MKKIISCVGFIVIVFLICNQLTDILTPKGGNRYYMLEKYLEVHPEDTLHDVQIFGSCHAYTSFNPIYMEDVSGVTGFVYANAGEIIPTTYVRMVEQFEKHIPKVALVEIWGINPYETYDIRENIFGSYLAKNLERTQISLAKLEVINDFRHMEYENIGLLSMNFPFINYKERLVDGSLTNLDFNYSFEGTKPFNNTYDEMHSRLTNKGFKVTIPAIIEDYPEKQNYIAEGEFMEIESDIAKYILKIIDLCKQNNVELIFYRSPYISSENELKKLNHFQKICDENSVLFIDLEKEIQFDYTLDFQDYQHLSVIGANKVTDFLLPYIMEAMGIEDWQRKQLQRANLVSNSDFINPKNRSGKSIFTNSGETIDGWYNEFSGETIVLTEEGIEGTISGGGSGWYFYQPIVIGEENIWTPITAYFEINKCSGTMFRPIISCRDEDDREISYSWIEIEEGEYTVSAYVPPDTQSIRVGVFLEEAGSGDYISIRTIELYQGVLTVEQIHEMKN